MNNEFIPHPEIDFFKSNHRPYYISTGEYVQQSMGFKVPFHLCHVLNELGYEAYVTAGKPAPNLRTPLLNPDIIARHKAQGREAIAVYTEAMWGNVLQGDIVVRWMLNKIGLKVEPEHHAGDLFYYWVNEFSEKECVKELILPFVDRTIFNTADADENRRSGYAYYANKYMKYGGFSVSARIRDNGVSLCHDAPRTLSEIASVLRNVKYLICYEDSAILTEAIHCGCKRILVKSDFTAHLQQPNSPYFFEHFIDEDKIDFRFDEKQLSIDSALSYPVNNVAEKKNDFGVKYVAEFIKQTQNVQSVKPVEDELKLYCKRSDKRFIYGTGMTSDVVYNALNSVGIKVDGFVVSEDYFSKTKVKKGHVIKPLAKYIKEDAKNAGLVLAMLSENIETIIPTLKEHSISFFNPVEY